MSKYNRHRMLEDLDHDQESCAAPALPPVPLQGLPGSRPGFSKFGVVPMDTDAIRAAANAEFAKSALTSRATEASPEVTLRALVAGGHWARTEPPKRQSLAGLAYRIADVLKHYAATKSLRESEAASAILFDDDDPLGVELQCDPTTRNRLIALATGFGCNADGRGYLPPAMKCIPPEPDKPSYDSDKVWVVHRGMRPSFTTMPGLINLVRPRYCIQVDMDGVLPGVGPADDAIGAPWATATISEDSASAESYKVFKPESGKTKEKKLSLTFDKSPDWRYHHRSLQYMLIFIASSVVRHQRAQAHGGEMALTSPGVAAQKKSEHDKVLYQ